MPPKPFNDVCMHVRRQNLSIVADKLLRMEYIVALKQLQRVDIVAPIDHFSRRSTPFLV